MIETIFLKCHFFILRIFVFLVFTPTSPTPTSSAHCLGRGTGHGRTQWPSWLRIPRALRIEGTLGLHRKHTCEKYCTREIRQGLCFSHCHLHSQSLGQRRWKSTEPSLEAMESPEESPQHSARAPGKQQIDRRETNSYLLL